jgi:Photosynthetic reaction centre cytochrome C subunit
MRPLFAVLLLLPLSLFSQEKGGKKGPSPFEAPKNLKILPVDGLRQTMMAFNAGLGVMCTYCHVQGDFASDEKPEKATARMMITMAREVNAKFTDGKQHVSCFTCHRGETEPKMAAPAPPQ